MRKILMKFFLLALIFIPLWLNAQSKSQLEKQRKEKLKKIEEFNKILNETQKEKEINLGQLAVIEVQIKSKNELVNQTNKEIRLLDDAIKEQEETINRLEQELNALKKEYGQMIYQASKKSNSYNQLSFLLSSSSLNDLYNRLEYIKQYSDVRKAQFQQIEKLKAELIIEKQKKEATKNEKKELLIATQKENQDLLELKKKKDEIIATLSKQEKRLKEDLRAENKRLQQLDNQIAKRVREEIKKTSGSVKAGKITLTPEAAYTSKSFSDNQKKLIWPVASGFISRKFGRQEHPILEKIYIDNPGVNIQTQNGEKVRAVFEGDVDGIFTIPGEAGQSIMLRHGDFFTIYNGVKNVQIKTGQHVKAKTVMGEVSTDKDGVNTLKFCIWKNMQKLDPEQWLLKK